MFKKIKKDKKLNLKTIKNFIHSSKIILISYFIYKAQKICNFMDFIETFYSSINNFQNFLFRINNKNVLFIKNVTLKNSKWKTYSFNIY